MTKRFCGVTAGALALTLVAAPALAGQPGSGWMPIDQAIRKLGEAGYGNIQRIAAEDGRWEGKASKDGRVVKVTVDPMSGTVVEVAKGERKSEESKDGKKAD